MYRSQAALSEDFNTLLGREIGTRQLADAGWTVGMFAMRVYLASLTKPRLWLWFYLIWWAFAAVMYFDPSPRLWLSSFGISVIIGVALYLSTAYATAQKTALDRWQIIRFFMMPFCVSSFAALIKDQGFVLVFHPTLAANVESAACCASFWLLSTLAKLSSKRAAGR